MGLALEGMTGEILLSTQNNTKLPAMPQFCISQGELQKEREELLGLKFFWNKIAEIFVHISEPKVFVSQILRHYLTKEGRVRKLFYCLMRIQEPCIRTFEGLTRLNIFGISQTDIMLDVSLSLWSYPLFGSFIEMGATLFCS